MKFGYLSSYTIPMYQDMELVGFTFFNSCRQNVFNEENLSSQRSTT